MIISHSKKFIFIKTNKTASTSLQVFLSQFLDKNIDIISKDLEQENKKIYLDPIEYRSKLDEKSFIYKVKRIFKFKSNFTYLVFIINAFKLSKFFK